MVFILVTKRPYCGRWFKNKRALVMHIVHVHPVEYRPFGKKGSSGFPDIKVSLVDYDPFKTRIRKRRK